MKTILSAKSFVLGLALLLMISILGTAVGPAGQVFAEAGTTVQAAKTAGADGKVTVTGATYAAAEYILSSGVTYEWQAIALAQAGFKVPDSYVQALIQKVQAADGKFKDVLDYVRIVLAAKAVGADPANFAGKGTAPGYNLVERIYNHDKISGQMLNYPVFALLALDSGSYTIPSNAKWSKSALLDEILSKQNADGGFALVSGASDPDMTAMTLTALAAHKTDPAVNTAGQKAVAWLASAQNGKGGYGDSSESVAQVIIGLTSFGIDPESAQFTKNNMNLVESLLSFRLESGAFAHTKGGTANAMATEQGLQALGAYNLYSGGGKGKLYDFSQSASQHSLVLVPLVIEGPDGTLGQGKAYAGNALEALIKVAAENKLQITNPSGDYVTGIGNVQAGAYGGWDGWMYAVARGGEWVNPSVGMKDFTLKESDRVLVYYGGGETQLVNSVVLSKEHPKGGESFSVTVTQIKWDWNGTASNPVITKAAGLKVAVGEVTATTDVYGNAVFTKGVPAGDYTLAVTGYVKGNAPAVARYTQPLKVGGVFGDEKQISAWARESVYSAYHSNLMEGVSSSSLIFAPKQSITRAEFAALLLRLTGNTPSAASAAPAFSDVKSGAWYYGVVQKAKELGIVDGVTATTFNPGGIITRQDMAVMIVRAFKLADTSAAPASKAKFKDEARISSYALSAVRTVTGLGYLTGFNGSFDPVAPVTREMAAVVAVRLP